MKELTVSSKRVFDGKLLKVDSIDVDRSDQTTAQREVVRHPGAVAALAQDVDGNFVFVRQYRKAVEAEMLEIVAGILEEEEAPEACVVREVGEETGYGVERLVRLGRICTSPGYTEEKVSLYYARLREWSGKSLPDEDESIEVLTFSREEVEQMVVSGQIEDAKTLSALWLYDKANRDGRI